MPSRRSLPLLALLIVAAAPPPKISRDAPICAVPGAAQLFLSPMGEPFRAAAGQAYPSAAWFAQADTIHDGAIDRAELIADARRFFATLDRDHDGRLTPEEVIAYERDVAPEIALYAERPEGARPRSGSGASVLGDLLGGGSASADYGGPMGAGRYAWLNVPEPVAAADADVNRVIDAGEFAAAAGRRFDALDKTGAGRLRLADLPKTPAQQAIEGPCQPRKPVKRDAADASPR